MFVRGGYAQAPLAMECFQGHGQRHVTLAYELAGRPFVMVDNVEQTVAPKGQTGADFYYAIGDAVLVADAPVGSDDHEASIQVTYYGRYPKVATKDN